MKRLLGISLVTMAMTLSGMAAGLIIVHDEDFWRHSPPLVVPPRPTWPEPAPPDRRIPPRPIPPREWAALEVSFTKADVKVRDQFATTRVEQEFYNPNDRQLEGTFLFPVPKGAHIDKFTMEINGKPVEAELLAADKARRIYEDIVRRLKDPALLEYSGRDLFKVRIFPIEPHAKKRITLSYSQLLKSDAGLVSFVLPLNTEKFSAKPLRSVSVKVDLESKRGLKSIYSPSHKVEVKRNGANKATIGFEANDVKPDADFQLFYTQDESDLGVNLLTYKPAGEDGYFLLLASPGVETRNTKVISKDVVFVLDTSGSMAGPKLTQAKKALAFCVENLNDGDRFEILRFATEVEPLFDSLTEVSKSNRDKAQKFIEGLKPLGGTAIDDALKKAVAIRPEQSSRPYVVVFLTDGRPTVGDVNEDRIVEHATMSKTGGTRIFCFGIGTDVNTHLLDRIAEDTKAFSQYVLPEEDIEVKVSSFFTKIKEPVLANPKLAFPDAVRVTKLYPSPVPDVFKGEQLIIAGRYSGSGDGAIRIEGDVSGDTKKFAYDVRFPAEASEHEFIPRLWATRRVGYLLDEIRLHGESKELKDEVTELARKYGVVTPYTAFLINEDERRREVPLSLQSMPRLNEERLRREASDVYYAFKDTKEGDFGVAGARSFQRLKEANSPEALVSGNVEVLRVAPAAAPSMANPTRGGTGFGGRSAMGSRVSSVTDAAKAYGQQSKFAGGRTFFQNGEQWVDAEVQKKTNARKVRLQFGSDEYFALMKKNPTAQNWLALGKNMQFVIEETVYEVYE